MSILDFLFGWLPRLPSDLTLIVVALLTSGSLTLVRKWTTNQDLLGRIVADEKRLDALMKEAKRRRDKDALARYRATKAQIGMIKFKQEGKPALVSLLPIALLATWAFARLPYLPPKPGEPVGVVAHAPISAAGDIVYIVPQAGIAAETGWVQEFAVNGSETQAVWRVKSDAILTAAQLTARGEGGPVRIELQLKERKLFGIVPGIPKLDLAAWMVGYLVLVIPLVPLHKKVLGIY